MTAIRVVPGTVLAYEKFMKDLKNILKPFNISESEDFFPQFIFESAGENDPEILKDVQFGPAVGTGCLSLSFVATLEKRDDIIAGINQVFPSLEASPGEIGRQEKMSILLGFDKLITEILPTIPTFLRQNESIKKKLQLSYSGVTGTFGGIVESYGIDTRHTDILEETICKLSREKAKLDYVNTRQFVRYLDKKNYPEDLTISILSFIPTYYHEQQDFDSVVTTESIFMKSPEKDWTTLILTTVPLTAIHHISNYFNALMPGTALALPEPMYIDYKKKAFSVVSVEHTTLLDPRFLRQFELRLQKSTQEELDDYRLKSKRIDRTMKSCTASLKRFCSEEKPSESTKKIFTLLNSLVSEFSQPNFKFNLKEEKSEKTEQILAQTANCLKLIESQKSNNFSFGTLRNTLLSIEAIAKKKYREEPTFKGLTFRIGG